MDNITRVMVPIVILAIAVVFYFGTEKVLYNQYMTAIEEGRLLLGMTQEQVLAALGAPDEVRIAGFAAFEKTVWIYKTPFRSVTSNYEGRVIDWVPKGH